MRTQASSDGTKQRMAFRTKLFTKLPNYLGLNFAADIEVKLGITTWRQKQTWIVLLYSNHDL